MADDKRMVQCIHCKYGRFMQWMKNPIICECERTHGREVAEAGRICPLFERTVKEVKSVDDLAIKHFSSYEED